MKPWRLHVWDRADAIVAARTALVCLAAYVAGSGFTSLFHAGTSVLGGIWSVVSGIVVLQATIEDTRGSAWLRILGTAIGAAVGAIYLGLLPFSPVGMAACVGVTVLFCQATGVPDHARLASVTVVIILAVSVAAPDIRPITNAFLRFVESCLGAGLAMIAVMLSPAPRKS
ncbi:MAG TPA: FUSC family protein [Thermoanaerobaculia bacterium]|jgi:uncharacterized membrane protein YccC